MCIRLISVTLLLTLCGAGVAMTEAEVVVLLRSVLLLPEQEYTTQSEQTQATNEEEKSTDENVRKPVADEALADEEKPTTWDVRRCAYGCQNEHVEKDFFLNGSPCRAGPVACQI